jgi:uncharacterized membrane protein
MLSLVVAYVSAAVSFVAIDMVWLGMMASQLYRPTLGDSALTLVNLPPAVMFYLLYPIGLVLFSVQPAMRSNSLEAAALMGALFGFFSYATYDLTNYATLRNWSLQLTLVDIAWGTALAAIASSTSYIIVTRFT